MSRGKRLKRNYFIKHANKTKRANLTRVRRGGYRL